MLRLATVDGCLPSVDESRNSTFSSLGFLGDSVKLAMILALSIDGAGVSVRLDSTTSYAGNRETAMAGTTVSCFVGEAVEVLTLCAMQKAGKTIHMNKGNNF